MTDFTIDKINDDAEQFFYDIYKIVTNLEEEKYEFNIIIPILYQNYVPRETSNSIIGHQKGSIWDDPYIHTNDIVEINNRQFEKVLVIKNKEYFLLLSIIDNFICLAKEKNLIVLTNLVSVEKQPMIRITVYTRKAYVKEYTQKIKAIKSMLRKGELNYRNAYINILVLNSEYSEIDNKEKIIKKSNLLIDDKKSKLLTKKFSNNH